MVVLIVALTVAVFLLVEGGLRLAQKVSASGSFQQETTPGEKIRVPVLPSGLFVHPGHTWAEILPSGRVRTGIDDFVRYVLDRPDRLILRRPGEKVRQGDPLLTLERDGRRLTLPAPMSGVVERSNEALAEHPEKLNRTPYGDNWVCTLEPDRMGEEISLLKVAERASSWLGEEMRRLAEWLSALTPVKPGVAVQDGGLPASGVLGELDEEAWKDFQARFLERNGGTGAAGEEPGR